MSLFMDTSPSPTRSCFAEVSAIALVTANLAIKEVATRILACAKGPCGHLRATMPRVCFGEYYAQDSLIWGNPFRYP